jgi:hypothetical protein
MSTGSAPLWEFSRDHLRPTQDTRTRIVAGLLTGVLYAGLALLAWLPFNRVKVPGEAPADCWMRRGSGSSNRFSLPS